MARLIKRKIKTTTADVYNENGERVITMEVNGAVSAPRMANIARRDFENTLLTVRNVHVSEDVYTMDEQEFIRHAERVGTVDVDANVDDVAE